MLFCSLKKKDRYEWTVECDDTFTKLNIFLTSTHVHTFPREELPLLLYLSITDQTMSSIFVQETDKTKRHVYFVRKVFRGDKDLY